MRSVRFDPELDEHVRRAAEREGTSVSAFIRVAVAERAQRTLSTTTRDRLGDVLGVVHAGGGRARRTGTAFTEAVVADRREA